MGRNEFFHMPQTSHPLLLHAYLFNFSNLVRKQWNLILNTIDCQILSLPHLDKYFTESIHFSNYLKRALGLEVPSIDNKSEINANRLLLQQFIEYLYTQHYEKPINRLLAEDDMVQFQTIKSSSQEFIKDLLNDNKLNPHVWNYKQLYPISGSGFNVLVAQLKVTYNDRGDWIRIPLLGSQSTMDCYKLTDQTIRQLIPEIRNRHTEAAMMGHLYHDLFHTTGQRIILKRILELVVDQKVRKIYRMELEIASMKSVCADCQQLLLQQHYNYTKTLQKEVIKVFTQVAYKCQPLYKKVMFMQLLEDSIDIQQSATFQHEKLPSGLFSAFMFKYRYQEHQHIPDDFGDLRTPLNKIQMTHTMYLSCPNTSTVPSLDRIKEIRMKINQHSGQFKNVAPKQEQQQQQAQKSQWEEKSSSSSSKSHSSQKSSSIAGTEAEVIRMQISDIVENLNKLQYRDLIG